MTLLQKFLLGFGTNRPGSPLKKRKGVRPKKQPMISKRRPVHPRKHPNLNLADFDQDPSKHPTKSRPGPPEIGAAGPGNHLADYSVERQAFSRARSDLMARMYGKFVVFVGEEMIGPHDSFLDAVREARRKYGRRAIYTKQLVEDDSVR